MRSPYQKDICNLFHSESLLPLRSQISFIVAIVVFVIFALRNLSISIINDSLLHPTYHTQHKSILMPQLIPKTPIKQNTTLKQIYLQSQKKAPQGDMRCLMCLQCCSQCQSHCRNPHHLICTTCACDWQADHLCPVCRNDSMATVRKEKYVLSEITDWTQEGPLDDLSQ